VYTVSRFSPPLLVTEGEKKYKFLSCKLGKGRSVHGRSREGNEEVGKGIKRKLNFKNFLMFRKDGREAKKFKTNEEIEMEKYLEKWTSSKVNQQSF
jgi:hypothetical protein